MDRNQVTGILLILLILTVYFQFFAPTPTPPKKDTTAKTAPAPKSTAPATLSAATPANDSLTQARNQAAYGSFATAASGEEKDFVLENKDIKVTLSTKGGRVKEVLLKKYLTYDKKPLVLLDENNSRIALEVNTPQGRIDLHQLYFATSGYSTVVAAGADDTSRTSQRRISFRLEIAPNQYVEQTYSLPEQGYQLGYDLKMAGLDNVVRNEPVHVDWQENLQRLEQDLEQSRITSTINYYMADGEFNNLSEASKDKQEKTIDQPIQWISMKHKFFSSAIIARTTAFQHGVLQSSVDQADTNTVKMLSADLTIPIADLKSGKGHFDFYFGPNNYQIVKKVAPGFGDNVYLGWPVVRWINQFVTVPLFNFLQRFIGNYGIIIIVLVLLIKLILSPLTYKSYISMAKMRVLQPELAEIKEKTGGDAAKAQQEQMKLYQQVGVSPLSGCIPVLLSMPVLFAMFSFFPSSIELRQQSFLWAHDLSTYDSVLNLPFKIPFYGSHVSLFAILMTISSIAYAYFNNQLTTVEGPMKSLGYIMPVVFLFVMNNFSAGLSFYYFVSNLATIAQQVIIRRFIDEDKIKRLLEENRKTAGTRKKSKFAARIEEAMKASEEIKKKK